MSKLYFSHEKEANNEIRLFFYHNDGIHSFTLLNHSCCSFSFVVLLLAFSFLLLFFAFLLQLFAIVFYSPLQILTTIGTLFGLGLHLLFHDIPEHRRCNLTTTWNIMLAICFVISYPNRTY